MLQYHAIVTFQVAVTYIGQTDFYYQQDAKAIQGGTSTY